MFPTPGATRIAPKPGTRRYGSAHSGRPTLDSLRHHCDAGHCKALSLSLMPKVAKTQLRALLGFSGAG